MFGFFDTYGSYLGHANRYQIIMFRDIDFHDPATMMVMADQGGWNSDFTEMRASAHGQRGTHCSWTYRVNGRHRGTNLGFDYVNFVIIDGHVQAQKYAEVQQPELSSLTNTGWKYRGER